MTDQLDDQIREFLGDAQADTPRPVSWNDVLVRAEAVGSPAPQRNTWARPLMVAASLLLVVGVGAALELRTAGDEAEFSSDPSTPTDVVEVVDDTDTDLRTLAEYTTFEDGDVVIPTTLPDGFEIQPLLVREWSAEATAIREGDDPGTLTITTARDTEGSNVVGRREIGGVGWDIQSPDPALHVAGAQLGDGGVSVFADGIDLEDFETVLAGLRVGTADDHPEISYDVDAGAQAVYRSFDDDLRLKFAQIGKWSCWSVFEATTVQASIGGCVDPEAQPDGARVLDTVVRTFPDRDDDLQQVTTIGYVPEWGVGVEVEYPDGRVDQVEVTDETGGFDAKFFVARADIDATIDMFDDDRESVVQVRALYDSDSEVVPVDVETDALRPLAEFGDGDVAIPTVLVASVDPEPMITRADGRADLVASSLVDGERRSIVVGTMDDPWLETDEVDDRGPPDRVADINGVQWDIRIFQDVSFAAAHVGDRVVSVDSIGITADTLDLVLGGLRAGPATSAPEGTYDVDAGAETVFRSEAGDRSLEYLEMGRWRCWTVRDAGDDAIDGGCADPDPERSGAVLISRFATTDFASDDDPTVVSTTAYTVGVLSSEAVAVDIEYGAGRIEQDTVDDLTGSFDAKFFVARAEFEGNVSFPDVVVRAIIDPGES